MGQVGISDHLHDQLKDLKQAEEHKSLDSVIRVLLERAKRVDSTGDHVTALDDSEHGTIEVVAGNTRSGADIDPLLPPEDPTHEELEDYVNSIWTASNMTASSEFNPVEFSDIINDPNITLKEAAALIASEHLTSLEVRPHKSAEEVVESIQNRFPDSETDEEIILEHISRLTDTLTIDAAHTEQLLIDHYRENGVPSRTQNTLEVDLDEVVALVKEVEESDTPRGTARDLLTAGSDNKYSWGTIWFLAPLSPDVERMSSDGSISVGKSIGMAWTCNECRVEGHRANIVAIRINEFGEVSQVQCENCETWSNYGLHERFPVSSGSEVRVEWESDQPM